MDNQAVERKPYEPPQLRFEDSIASKINNSSIVGSGDTFGTPSAQDSLNP